MVGGREMANNSKLDANHKIKQEKHHLIRDVDQALFLRPPDKDPL